MVARPSNGPISRYLAAIKEQNGGAMSFGRNSAFFDIYFERDLAEQTITESEVQEIIDHLVMKMRIVRFIRTPDYDELFSGDPTLVTECIGGVGEDGRPLVTRPAFVCCTRSTTSDRRRSRI